MPVNKKRESFFIVFICAGAYFTSYLTRVNYKAVLAEIIASEGLTKDAASAALTGMFIVYGLGQLLSGWLGDRINPKYLMCTGLIVASVMNLLLPAAKSTAQMTVIWCVNGFGQALMWPPIVKEMSNYLTEEQFLTASARVSWGSNFATVLIYLLSPLVISFSGWRTVFFICGGFGLLATGVVWAGLSSFEKKYGKIRPSRSFTKSETPAPDANTPCYTPFIVILLCLIVVAIMLQGMLRDGIDTWMPSYVTEVFSLPTGISILSGVVFPIFSTVSYEIARLVYRKLLRNEMLCAGAFFGLCGASSALLPVFRESSPVVSVFLFALAVGSMHAVNLIVTCYVTRRFRKFGNISTISGVTNFATYAGSALSTYGFATLTEKGGWNATINSWIVIAALGVAFCVALCFPWRKFLARYHGSENEKDENSN